MKTSPCKGCGKPIVWAKTLEGKMIPLDPKPPIYWVEDDGNGGQACHRIREGMVSHFSTCPNANDFSASKKRGD